MQQLSFGWYPQFAPFWQLGLVVEAQNPAEHAGVEPLHATGLPHWPSDPQVFTEVPLAHWLVPGVQATLASPPPGEEPLLDPEDEDDDGLPDDDDPDVDDDADPPLLPVDPDEELEDEASEDEDEEIVQVQPGWLEQEASVSALHGVMVPLQGVPHVQPPCVWQAAGVVRLPQVGGVPVQEPVLQAQPSATAQLASELAAEHDGVPVHGCPHVQNDGYVEHSPGVVRSEQVPAAPGRSMHSAVPCAHPGQCVAEAPQYPAVLQASHVA